MKRYKIRSGSIADYVICSSPFILFILLASLGHLLTGTF